MARAETAGGERLNGTDVRSELAVLLFAMLRDIIINPTRCRE
jgi:hypothetical protein